MPTTIFGDEFLINQQVQGGQHEPQILLLPDGRLLFTWWGYDPDIDADGGISARIGTPQSNGSIVWAAVGEFRVNEETSGYQVRPDTTLLPDGRILFTWDSADPDVDGDNNGISARVGTVQSNGSIVWASAGEVTVNEEVQSYQIDARATVLADGRVLFVWESDDPDVDGSLIGISARVGAVQADGSIVWGTAGEVTVNDEVLSIQEEPEVLLLSDGRILVTWHSSDPDADGSSYAVVARVGSIEADGSITWGAAGELTVNQVGNGDQLWPQILQMSDGRVLAAWFDGNLIMARVGVVEGNGSITWSDQVEVNQGGNLVQLTMLADGRALFVWEAGSEIRGRIGAIQSDGSVSWEGGGESTLNQHGIFPSSAQATVLPDGRVAIAWQSYNPPGDGGTSGIAGRVVLFNAPTQAQDDTFSIAEVNAILGSDLFANNGAGIDSEWDGEPFTITAVNGSALNVGSQITLASGALLTVNANGTFDYDPNGGPAAMYQAPAIDSFTYTIDDGFGGTSTATVTISVSSAGDLIIGDYLGNTLNGGAYGDLIIAVEGDDTLNGGDGADALDGGDGADTLNGDAGGDFLYGRLGEDTLNGGTGRDSLFGGDGADVLNGGADDDTLDGGADGDALNGDDGVDTLRGRAGNDTLNGGASADFMFGGGGDDTYYVDTVGDEAGELSASGTDTVIASINYVLPFYIENLTLTGAAANGAGNVLANTITGTGANNTLQGLGGADTINAGDGADTIYGGDGGDQLNGQAGNDLIDGGNFDDTLNGGDDNDILYGRQNNDTLNGDAGNDTLYGGDGADTAQGGDGGDLVDGGNGDDALEGGAGADTLYGRQNNDALSGGADNDTLFGGDGDDTLSGGDGADALFGGNGGDRLDGGLGADVLNGAAGADTFVFSTALGGGNIDTLVGFSVTDDTIELSTTIFTSIGLGALAANAFVIGSAATTADHRIIYDPTTGGLFYDADGDGAGAAVQFATLAAGLALTESDFLGGP